MGVSRCLLVWISLSLWLVCAAAGVAQTTSTGPDFEQWDILSDRAEGAIAADRASDAAFEAVRAELARFRQEFLDATSVSTPRIETLQSQLESLGPVPTDGSEAPETAAQRAIILRELQAARAPILAAQSAYTEADVLIKEIDRILDERRKETLTRRSDSPLLPVHWPGAIESLAVSADAVFREFIRALGNPQQREAFVRSLPLVLLLSTIGMVLIVRGRRWAFLIVQYLRRFGGRGLSVGTFLFSLGRIILPVIGIMFLTEALFSTGLVGLRGARILEGLPLWGAYLLVLRWLCETLFSKVESDALVPLSATARAELRFYGTALGVLYVANDILTTLLDLALAPDIDRAVVAYPILLVAAVILFRLGQILVSGIHPGSDDDEETQSKSFNRFARNIGRFSIVIAVVSPILAAVGYTNLAPALLYPTLRSLALFGLALVFHRFLTDLYGLISGRGVEARDSLVSTLLGFAIAVAIVPLLALIWGARPVELVELWTIFNEGVSIGETRISPTNFLTFAVVFGLLYMVTRLVQGALKDTLLPKTRLDAGGQNAVVSGVGYLGMFLAALIAVTTAGINLSGLAIVAGALSVGIGFGLQTIVQNFVSGIILLVERPIAEGDWIEVNGRMGYVRDISVRSTRIETFDRTDVIVPNADFISGTVTNYTRGNTIGRVIVPVGVAYGTDTRRVEAILREIAEGHPMILAAPPPSIVFQGFGADSLDFEIRGILRDVNWVLSVKSEINHAIAKRFAEEGIEIPFAQRDVWLRNPEALPGAGEQDPST